MTTDDGPAANRDAREFARVFIEEHRELYDKLARE